MTAACYAREKLASKRQSAAFMGPDANLFESLWCLAAAERQVGDLVDDEQTLADDGAIEVFVNAPDHYEEHVSTSKFSG